jgi:hypothetical protein
MQKQVAKKLSDVQKAKDAVSQATQTLDKTDMEKAHSATQNANENPDTEAAGAGNSTDVEKAKEENAATEDDAKKKKEEEKKEEDQAVADETSKLVKDKMDEAIKQADDEAKKDAKEKAKAIVDEAKNTGLKGGPKSIADAQDALNKALDEHASAIKKLASAKIKAGVKAVKYKATAKAIEGIQHAERAVAIPISDDDMVVRPKLSAVDWAKKAAEERLIAYRDHMASAHAADKEAATSQALLNTENEVSKLEREVEVAKLKIDELKGIVKEARFDAEEVKARGKFTTRGEMAKLKYQQIDEKNENEVSKEESKLIEARQNLMLSERALGELKAGGVLHNAQMAEKTALGELAGADATARIATEKVLYTKEKADKANALVVSQNERKKAEKALKAKKMADALLDAQKTEQTKANDVENAKSTLKKVKVATEKGEKSAVQAKIASEKAKKAEENKAKLTKMKANEGDAKSVEKKKKVNEQQAKALEKAEQAKEETAKASKKAEIESKSAANEKTAKANSKEAEKKKNSLSASEEKAQKKEAKEAKMKAKLEKQRAAAAATGKEGEEKIKAASAGGTPCDTCLAKCTSHICRTWCNAHWCEGMKPDGGKKELMEKLMKAREEQADAAKDMNNSKERLDKTMAAEKTASGNAKNALEKAAETGQEEDVKEARSETENVEEVQKEVKEGKTEYKKEADKDTRIEHEMKQEIADIKADADPPKNIQMSNSQQTH